MTIKFTNNATTTLASGINSSATSLTVATGTGALFPSLSGSDVFYVTLANLTGTVEIVKVTARSSDTLTIVRGQDNTTAAAWLTGDKVELRPTAGILNTFVQQDPTTPSTFGFKNRLINGAMAIDQRNAGASVTANQSIYFVDRWVTLATQTSKATVQQSTTAPAGFGNSFVYTSSSAYSVLSTDYFGFAQQIEGNNMIDFAWGTASAATVTLSFWVRSSLTGTFGGSLRNNAGDRSYPFTYTISAANTWEQKSITIVGDTSGSWPLTNGIGIRLLFNMGSGSNHLGTAGSWAAANYLGAIGQSSLVGTNGATLYITGVQLEKGSTSTSFDYRPYGTEFALCQRYYQVVAASSFLPAGVFSTNRVLSGVPYNNCMRTTPTGSIASGGFTFFISGAANSSSTVAVTPSTTGYVSLDVGVTATTGTAGVGSTTSNLTLSAEL